MTNEPETRLDVAPSEVLRPGDVIKIDDTGELFQLISMKPYRYRTRRSADDPWVEGPA